MEYSNIACFKYSGKKTEEGYLDARHAAEVFLAIDQAVRFVISRQAPHWLSQDLEVPLMVKKGSWEVWLPDVLKVVGGIVAGEYLRTAAKELASNDFKGQTTKDLIKKAIKVIRWTIKVASHMGSAAIKKFDEVKCIEVNNTNLIGITNLNGELLYVPKEYLEFYTQLPIEVLNKLAKPVSEESIFSIEFIEQEKNDKDDVTGEVRISIVNKHIFIKEEGDEILFPELGHGEEVEIEGHISRGNEKTNTIGFEYKGHILTCSPKGGKVSSNKQVLFTNCKMTGVVDRINKEGDYIERKPRIIYSKIEIMDVSNKQLSLLE